MPQSIQSPAAMTDIPQEVREAAMSDHERFITAVAYDSGYQAGLKAGKRAGMERAAEIAEDAHNATGLRWTPKAIAQAIRSENHSSGN